jgi:hypothetical protein
VKLSGQEEVLMPAPDLSSLEKIQAELRRYEHPLLEFQAVEHPGGVQVIISLKVADILEPYTFVIPHRDLQDPRYGWRFQNLLFNYIHDYMIETFTHTPHHIGT